MIAAVPDSRGAWLRCGIIVLVLLVVCWYRNVFTLRQLATYQPQEGDVVFQSLPHGDLVDAIEGVTNSPWSHCGVVVLEGSSWKVAEAIGTVHKTPLALWIMRGRRGRFEAYRPRSAPAAGTGPLHAALDRYMGRPYDYHYAPGEKEIYCSELVYDAYRDAYGMQLGDWRKLGDLNWKPYERFIRWSEEGAVPLDREIITPVELTRSSFLERVYFRRE